MLFLCFTALVAFFTVHTSAATVFAHFMMANSFAYNINQWEADMAAALQIGIDGFALNWTPPDCASNMDWTVSRIDDAFTAAQQTGFKLIHSFDMSWSDCNTYWNQTFMADMIDRHAGSSATYRWNSNILVSTYGGDMAPQYSNAFFQGLKDRMKSTNTITLAPALVSYSREAQTNPQSAASKLLSDYPSVDGFFNWQAWPLDTKSNVSATPDQVFSSTMKNAGRTGPYIMGISPWQYKDLNNGNPADSWMQYSDMLFPKRFEQITSDHTIQPDIIELISWNDFCESHYLRDLPSTRETATDFVELGTMSPYVVGVDHSAWRILAHYYITWWKTGKQPPITQDQVIFWYRQHPKAAVCLGGASSYIRNHDYTVDAVFAWALVSQVSQISITVGRNTYWTFQAGWSGPATSMIPFPSDLGFGIVPEVAIMRGGKIVQWGNGSLPITSGCAWQNFNPVVALAGPALPSP